MGSRSAISDCLWVELSSRGYDSKTLRRLQIDIETSYAAGYEMSNPARDHILSIAVSDSTGWETLLVGEESYLLWLSRLLLLSAIPM